MSEKIKFWTIVIVLTTLAIVLNLCIFGCDDDKTVFHYKVYRENRDGGHTLWTMNDKPDVSNGFVSWRNEDGNLIQISGKITIESFKVGGK